MKKYQIAIALTLLLVFILAVPVSADAGPKPEMQLTFLQENGEPNHLRIISGTLYECDLPDCSDALSFENEDLQKKRGPRSFICEDFSCHTWAYGFAEYFQLEITFEDGSTQKSNVFTKKAYQASYLVTLSSDNTLIVREETVKKENILIPLFLTLCVELTLGYLYARKKNFSLKRFLLGIFIVNLLTNPILNIILWGLSFYAALIFWVFGEIVIILFEWIFIYFFMKKEIGFWKSLLLSFSFNLASAILGLFL